MTIEWKPHTTDELRATHDWSLCDAQGAAIGHELAIRRIPGNKFLLVTCTTRLGIRKSPYKERGPYDSVEQAQADAEKFLRKAGVDLKRRFRGTK